LTQPDGKNFFGRQFQQAEMSQPEELTSVSSLQASLLEFVQMLDTVIETQYSAMNDQKMGKHKIN